MTTETSESDLELADARVRREFSRADCQKIAERYRKACAAGGVRKPMSMFMVRIINAAAGIDRWHEKTTAVVVLVAVGRRLAGQFPSPAVQHGDQFLN